MVPSDELFLVKDLARCEVFTESGEPLGRVVDVYPTGGNDVIIVKGPRREYLIPALKSVVVGIDLAAGRIVVRFPPGLREIYED